MNVALLCPFEIKDLVLPRGFHPETLPAFVSQLVEFFFHFRGGFASESDDFIFPVAHVLYVLLDPLLGLFGEFLAVPKILFIEFLATLDVFVIELLAAFDFLVISLLEAVQVRFFLYLLFFLCGMKVERN